MSTDNWAGSSKETAWSDWEWNVQYNCNYRYRRNALGEWEYDYDQQGNQGVAADISTPRSTEGLDEYQEGTLAPILESTQPDYSSSTIYSTSQGNYRYDRSVATDATALAHQFDSLSFSQDAHGEGRETDTYNAVPEYLTQNPSWQPSDNLPSRIFTRDPKSKFDLDRNFEQHKSKEFYFGRIFKVLWSEPYGSGGTEITERAQVKGKFGEKVYSSIRRFVIVDSKKGHSICLPILTYGGQGTKKRGVHPEHHAQIYTLEKNQKKAPPLKEGEVRLTKKAIRVDPISPSHKLDPASRLNYAKLYTVEHNVKVYFVGWVAKHYEQYLVTDYNDTHQPLAQRPWATSGAPEDLRGTGGESPEYHIPASVDQAPQEQYDPSNEHYQDDDPSQGHEDLYGA